MEKARQYSALMAGSRWHILRDETGLTLCRTRPPQFDFCAQTRMPRVNMTRLAHQIRQDMWRRLQSLRGFQPIVRVEKQRETLLVTAGGQVMGRTNARLIGQVADMLEDHDLRARWVRFAGRRRASDGLMVEKCSPETSDFKDHMDIARQPGGVR
ncbi:MAG: hypothetical protein AB8B71_01330 [Paracoccaceae bacterium]